MNNIISTHAVCTRPNFRRFCVAKIGQGTRLVTEYVITVERLLEDTPHLSVIDTY